MERIQSMMPSERRALIQRFMVWCRKYKIPATPDAMLDWLQISGALDPVWITDQDPVIEGEYLVTMLHRTKKKDVWAVRILSWTNGQWITDRPNAVIAWQMLPDAYIEYRRKYEKV